MNVDSDTGLLSGIEGNGYAYCPSPNHDQRPDGMPVDLVVVHCISLPPGHYGGDAITRFFTNTLPADEHPYFREIHSMRVSAHVLIQRDGSIIQFVPFHLRAWHAGQSRYGERERCNDFSVGIELEGTDHDIYEPAQYEILAELVNALRRSYPGIGDNVTGHCHIAPERKTDPGSGFDWQRLHSLLGISAKA